MLVQWSSAKVAKAIDIHRYVEYGHWDVGRFNREVGRVKGAYGVYGVFIGLGGPSMVLISEKGEFPSQ